MLNFRRLKIILVLSIIIVLLLVSGIALRTFFARPPVLIVIDISFSQLYGPDRLERQFRSVSLSLFRQVIPVLVGEGAGPELVAIAVEDAFDGPWAAVFPYRYIDGARRYKEAVAETQVVMIGSPSRLDGDAFFYVNTDTDTDLYRAGMAAALLTGEKRPLFFSDGVLPDGLRDVFQQGLTDNGCLQEPIFLNSNANYSAWADIGCVIVNGPASRFVEEKIDIPMILFSWIDPSLTPGTVKLLFDDSHLTLAVEALKALPAGDILLPSSPSIFEDRIGEKGIYSKLKDIIRKK